MGGGKSTPPPGSSPADLTTALNTSRGLIGTSASQSGDLYSAGSSSMARRNELIKPFVDQQKSIASGNYGDILAASSLPLGLARTQTRAGREQIMNTIPAGATRDYALAENEREGTKAAYDFMRAAYLQAPRNLVDVGGQEAQVGLSEIGAGQSALNTALSASNNLFGVGTQGNLKQQEIDAQRRAATLSFLGNLIGTLGGPLAGKI